MIRSSRTISCRTNTTILAFEIDIRSYIVDVETFCNNQPHLFLGIVRKRFCLKATKTSDQTMILR